VGAFIWRQGVSADLGGLGGSNIFVSGISGTGAATGQADISTDLDPRFGMAAYNILAEGIVSVVDLVDRADHYF
jgi:hypothetical protein